MTGLTHDEAAKVVEGLRYAAKRKHFAQPPTGESREQLDIDERAYAALAAKLERLNV